MVQTKLVITEIEKIAPDIYCKIVPLSTLGDRILDKPLLSFGGKGAFVSEFEAALIRGEIDIAVHSAKDMSMLLPEELEIIGVPKREDPRDVLVTMKGANLKENAVIGTSSLRRQYQIQSYQKVVCKDLRGNVGTRLQKLEEGRYDGIILAAAGLKRLGLHEQAKYDYHYFAPNEFVPAGCQGIMAVEGRKGDKLIDLVSKINDRKTLIAFQIERYVLTLLNAGCHEPIGVYAYLEKDVLHLLIMRVVDGKIYRVKGSCQIAQREALAKTLTKALLKEEAKYE